MVIAVSSGGYEEYWKFKKYGCLFPRLFPLLSHYVVPYP